MGSANFDLGEVVERIIDKRIDALSSTFSSFNDNDLSQTLQIVLDIILKLVGAVLVFHN